MSESAPPTGQAPRPGLARRTSGGVGRGLHFAFRTAVALLLLASLAMGALAVRLAQGPLPLPGLARIIENAANEGGHPTRVGIGGVALEWAAGDATADRPILLSLSDIALTDTAGRRVAALPEARVSLSLRALLVGRIAARSVELRGLDLRVMRAADGSLALDLGSQGERLAEAAAAEGAPGGAGMLPRLLAELTGADEGHFGRHQLRHAVLREARLAVVDHALGVTWSVPDLDITLLRAAGGVDLAGAATLMLGPEAVRLSVDGAWRAEPWTAGLTLRFGAVRPAQLAAQAPALAPLALLDAAVLGEVSVALDPGWRPASARLAATIGPGRIVPPGAAAGIPLRGASAVVEADRAAVTLRELTLALDSPGAPEPLAASATLRLGEAPALSATARLPRFDIAHLAAAWPEGLLPEPRAWLAPNVTAGTVRDVALSLEASLPPDLSDLTPTALALTGQVEGAVVHYLRPMPPAEQARGRFRVDLDTVEITAEGARIGRSIEGRGTVRLTDLARRPQNADIALDISAPVADVMALLQHPRLKLFDRRPLPPPVREATGSIAARLSIRFPLLNDIPVEAVQVATEGTITDARIPRMAMGQDISDARLSLAVGNDGLRLSGPVRVAAVPLTVTYEQDFRSGPANQVIERIRAEGRAEERLLAALGLDTDGRLGGAPAASLVLAFRRNGTGEGSIRADLREATLAIPEAGFAKPRGVAGTAEAGLRLAGERVTALENLRIETQGLALRGRVGFAQGRPERLQISSLAVGRTRASGELLWGREGALSVTLRGAVLDAAGWFAPPAEGAAPPDPQRIAPALRLDLGFERVHLANERVAETVALRLDRARAPDGGRIEALSASGRIGADGGFEATVARRATHRALTLRANDAGAFLQAVDLIGSMAGGRLSVEARFEEPGDALSGTAEITDFRMRDAPAIGRLLQAMTLYGMLDLARGPGLSFSQLTAPFSLKDGVLTLSDARAFSASLGVTARGRIDARARRLDIEGTLVPAYFFNSLLGNIPLVGRLFSPERGGGVFAATYAVRGPLADPQVTTNPLAALTPGFLRGLFGIFDGAPPGGGPPSPPAEAASPG